MDTKHKRILSYIKKKLERNGFSLVLRNSSYILRGKKPNVIECGGYFDVDTNELVVAAKGRVSIWFPILIHEFAHFLQWKTKSKVFMDGIKSDDVVESVLTRKVKKKLKPFVLKRHILKCIALELEAERITIRLIKHWNLKVNLTKYKQDSNRYFFLWGNIYHTHAWVRTYNKLAENKMIDFFYRKIENYINNSTMYFD